MAHETTYEVYTLADGRWLLDTRFKKSQRERAIHEGKKLAKQPGIDAVKVVREIYDDDDDLIKESTVYNSRKKEEEGDSFAAGIDDLAPAISVPGFEDLEEETEIDADADAESSGNRRGIANVFSRRKHETVADDAAQADGPRVRQRGAAGSCAQSLCLSTRCSSLGRSALCSQRSPHSYLHRTFHRQAMATRRAISSKSFAHALLTKEA